MKKLVLLILFLLPAFILKAQVYNMGNLGTVSNACGGMFYDSGGAGSNYGNGQTFVATFCAPPGQYITFNFTSFSLESNWDWLDIYNGPNTGSPYIGGYTGTAGPGMVTSTLGGCLTFEFTSDGTVTYPGWVATITCSTTQPSTGNDCGTALPFCTGTSYNFPNNTNQPNLGSIDCLLSTPNPVWYYMQIANPGNLNIDISQTDGGGWGIDVDFDLWGPFSTLADGCVAIYNGSAPSVDCSYSPSATEQANITGATTGQFYILLLTNYSNTPGTISFSATTGSTATTNCAILCNMTNLTATPSACVPASNSYTVSGQVVFTNPPSTGTLVINSSCGGSVSFNAPFVSPINYTIPGITASGGACNVTATFTGDPGCSLTKSYTAPASCASSTLNCPGYASTSTSPNTTCAGQVYYLDVANTSCNGTITFNVVGNYGSSYANEITWDVYSVLTGTIVASGGPGTNGGNFNYTVGPLNPAVYGNIFQLYVYDAWGDGFNGTGGTISVLQNGTTIAGPIIGNFGSQGSIIFGANMAISPATITITTPSGPVTSTVTGCNNFHVPLSLQNTNFCNTISVNLPYTVTCLSTGAVLASGIQAVTVYPSIPTTASDVVNISFNSTTCTWSMTPQNDCIASNIGTIFTVSPNPSSLPAPAACMGGNETFTVTYNGISGGPNCCSTGGPMIPIILNQNYSLSNVSVTNSPFGGTSNAAYLSIPPNNIGGTGLSFNLNINVANYCYNYAVATYYWVTVIVGGTIVYDNYFTTTTANVSLNLTNLPNGYNQNTPVQIYVYPNQLSPAQFTPSVPCGSLAYGSWSANITGSLNVLFADQNPTAAVCTFSPFLPYTCCSSTVVTDASATICSGASLTSLTTWINAVTTANSNCVVYSSVTPVAGSVLPDNNMPTGVNNGTVPIQETVMAYSYCDVNGDYSINAGDTYTLISTFTLTVNPAPTAAISGTVAICGGGSTTITFSGTPNATVTFTINGGSNQTIVLDAGGNATLNTGTLIATTTYNLVSVSTGGSPICTQALSGSAVVTINPPPVATFTYPSPVCNNDANIFPTFVGGGVAGLFSATPSGLTFVSTATGEINLSASSPGTYTITNFIASALGCPDVSATFSIQINPALTPTFSFQTTICSGALAPVLPTVSDNGVTGTWSPLIVNNTTSGSYTFTPSSGQCANPLVININVDPNPNLSPVYHD